ncbi:MAG: prolyl oligopeptidase family serine peptidase, partial [bacterium]
TLVVREVEGPRTYRFGLGTRPAFTADSRRVVFLLAPSEEEMEAAAETEMEPAERPKSSLVLVDLESGSSETIPRVRSYRLPEEGAGAMTYLEEPPLPAPEGEEDKEGEADEERGEGHTLVLRRLDGDGNWSFPNVTDHLLSPEGDLLVYVADAGEDARDGVYAVDTASGEVREVLTGPGTYEGLVLDGAGTQAAFLAGHTPGGEEEEETFSLYLWEGEETAREAVPAHAPGITGEMRVSGHSTPRFSENGRRLFFGTAPPPFKPMIGEDSEQGEVVVDIWHWQEDYLQPQQKLQADRERRRTYEAVYHIREDRVVQLEDRDLPSVRVGSDGDAPVALAESDLRYRVMGQWETPNFSDLWLVDVNTGERTLLMEEVRVRASLSPTARYLTWWDYEEAHWFAMDLHDRSTVQLSGGIPYPVNDLTNDRPMLDGPAGSAGWTGEEEHFLVYDEFDIWAADPSGRDVPRCITEEEGRRAGIRFRAVRLDREQETIDPGEEMLLTAFDVKSKASGFYRDRVEGHRAPERLLWGDHRYSTPSKAEEGDRLVYTRESYREFPDLWVSGTRFRNPRKMSEANPQMNEYLWGTAELVEWVSTDGLPLQGILYRPEDFDPAKSYPMMVSFYERSSDGLHQHWYPQPHRSIINYTFYTSRGYLVFIPDIVYRVGFPGESAVDCVIPGVLDLIDRGFVDADNIGMAGHSWGGYQSAFIITRSNLFKAAQAGAPVANMTSAYGGIRWGSGVNRQFQYERTQSRIGASLWDAPIRYIENSPLFFADKVETPLLIMHNDEDGAVPWEQGIELFTALRRLEKPVWMVVYNEQPHWPITWPNKKDWAVRLQQYFDHFLKGAPAPMWIEEGVPATRKEKTLGREIIPPR